MLVANIYGLQLMTLYYRFKERDPMSYSLNLTFIVLNHY